MGVQTTRGGRDDPALENIIGSSSLDAGGAAAAQRDLMRLDVEVLRFEPSAGPPGRFAGVSVPATQLETEIARYHALGKPPEPAHVRRVFGGGSFPH